MFERDVIFIDTETERFAPEYKAPRIACLTWATPRGEHGIVSGADAESFLKPHLLRAIEDPKYTIAGHTIAYDMVCLIQWGSRDLRRLIFEAYRLGRILCSEMRERLIDIANDELKGAYDDEGDWINKDYNLEELVGRICGVELDKGDDGWRLRYGELLEIPIGQWPERARTYAINDAKYGLEVYLDQERRLRGTSLPTQALEARADLGFKLTSTWGIVTDGERVDMLWRWTQQRLRALRRDLLQTPLIVRKGSKRSIAAMDPNDFNVATKKDTKYLISLVEKAWNVDLYGELPMTDGGKKGQPKPKTGKEVLEMLIDHPELKLLVEYNSLEKSGSTYIKKLFAGVLSTIHCSYWTLGARSSRASSSGPNMQNQPRLPGVRECFVAREGKSFVASDFTTQEMRALAQSCLDILGWSTLAQRFQTDPHFDAHLELAANRLLGISLAEAQARKKIDDKLVTDARQDAKIINFGLPGGMREKGLIKFAKGSGRSIDKATATSWIQAYEEERPEMIAYYKEAKHAVGRENFGKMVCTRSGFVRGGCGFTDWCNGHFQTPSAHATKEALFEACRRMYVVETSWLYGSRPVNCVHDEIMAECEEGLEHEVAIELEQVMCQEMSKFTPDIPTAAEAVAMKHWSKKAKRVFKNGRLVAWDGAFPITQEMLAA